MGERRIEAALRQATDTQNVNIAADPSVPDVFLEGFSECSAVVVAALYELILERDLGYLDIEATYLRARTIRKRYTVLDLAFEAGILEECVDELFAPDGFWGRAAASHARADEAGSFRRSDEA
jgi:hypothetical protein